MTDLDPVNHARDLLLLKWKYLGLPEADERSLGEFQWLDPPRPRARGTLGGHCICRQLGDDFDQYRHGGCHIYTTNTQFVKAWANNSELTGNRHYSVPVVNELIKYLDKGTNYRGKALLTGYQEFHKYRVACVRQLTHQFAHTLLKFSNPDRVEEVARTFEPYAQAVFLTIFAAIRKQETIDAAAKSGPKPLSRGAVGLLKHMKIEFGSMFCDKSKSTPAWICFRFATERAWCDMQNTSIYTHIPVLDLATEKIRMFNSQWTWMYDEGIRFSTRGSRFRHLRATFGGFDEIRQPRASQVYVLLQNHPTAHIFRQARLPVKRCLPKFHKRTKAGKPTDKFRYIQTERYSMLSPLAKTITLALKVVASYLSPLWQSIAAEMGVRTESHPCVSGDKDILEAIRDQNTIYRHRFESSG